MPQETLATSHSPLTTAPRLPETISRVESSLSYSKHSVGTRSTRDHRPTNRDRLYFLYFFASRPSPRAASRCPAFLPASQMTTHPPELLASPADLVCYSRRRTCVPPLGSRATAPAQPRLATRWCLGIAPVISARRTLPCSTASQANRPSPSPIPAVIEVQVKGVLRCACSRQRKISASTK